MINIQVVLHVRTVAQSTTFYPVYICLLFSKISTLKNSDVHNPISFTISSCNNTQTPSYDTTGKTQPCVKLWSQDKA